MDSDTPTSTDGLVTRALLVALLLAAALLTSRIWATRTTRSASVSHTTSPN
ncbi:hypothetical protein [Pseudokineococcus sp. 1T1Z-3]|uniref:hypothetical protein n=1 Tax=Pseudokineococcus sp. 1T1Z-3 TaxID=3132745 RepID=UPI0030AC225F